MDVKLLCLVSISIEILTREIQAQPEVALIDLKKPDAR